MAINHWYKDKVFYQIWPRSFKDGNGDGMGDLYGVYEKLDYIKSLGCDGIWFSPLTPPPEWIVAMIFPITTTLPKSLAVWTPSKKCLTVHTNAA